uniref:Uncharacterized protein n=1 Tax=Anopheles atroparvus TaxID=41427 RepID=A0AAG5DVP1_ANOAO
RPVVAFSSGFATHLAAHAVLKRYRFAREEKRHTSQLASRVLSARIGVCGATIARRNPSQHRLHRVSVDLRDFVYDKA